MGSRSDIACAYIAGFLDGDGSLMLQLKKRSDTNQGIRIMATICFYQDTRHEAPLHWIRKELGIGYVTQRNDGMSELRINGFAQIARILSKLLPHIRFKRVQASVLLKACLLLQKASLKKLTRVQKRTLIGFMLSIQHENYATRTKRSKEELQNMFGLTP